MTDSRAPIRVHAYATSIADSLGYLGQEAVSRAMEEHTGYRLIGGQMVRLLHLAFPAPRAALRSTLDADAAVEGVEVIGQVSEHLQLDGFRKVKANAFLKTVADDQEVEINLLLPRSDSTLGVRATVVDGLGHVDTLSELTFVLSVSPVTLEVHAELLDGTTLSYRVLVPTVEMATILKAHSWHNRRSENDLADLSTLLEIREEHPALPWLLDERALRGRRLDTARFLRDLSRKITRRTFSGPVPRHVDRYRFAALIAKHIGTP